MWCLARSRCSGNICEKKEGEKGGREGGSKGKRRRSLKGFFRIPERKPFSPSAGWERRTLGAVIVRFKNFHQMTSKFNSLWNVSFFSFSSSPAFLILVQFPFAAVDWIVALGTWDKSLQTLRVPTTLLPCWPPLRTKETVSCESWLYLYSPERHTLKHGW